MSHVRNRNKKINSGYFDDFKEKILNIEPYINIRSYDLLKLIIDNIENVIKFDYDNGGKVLNYYRIMIKCSIFEKLSDFSRFNFGIINFDKNKYTEKTGKNINVNSQKFLYVQSNESSAPYFMMGIKQPEEDIEDNQPKYVVETLIAPTKVEDFFNEQEVVIPTQILITTESKMDKLEATSSEKIALLNQYKSIISQYNLPNRLNIYGDYESILVEQEQVKTRKKFNI